MEMRNMFRHWSTLAAAMATATVAMAQQGAYREASAMQLWHGATGNAAALGNDAAALADTSLATRGVSLFDYTHGFAPDGYRLTKEGWTKNRLQFFSERYQRVGRYLYGYGAFRFDMSRTADRAWSDVMRPYGSNPYQSGSSVAGRYDYQEFALQAALGTVRLGRMRYGLSLDYTTADLSRLRDPRSRSMLADYRLSPSVLYEPTDRHAIGITVHYDRRKEKLPSLTTVQTDPNLMYYQTTGVDHLTGTTGGYNGYRRDYVADEVGGELSFSLATARWRMLADAVLSRAEENMYGDTKSQPGRYVDYTYSLKFHNRWMGDASRRELDVDWTEHEAYGDEYRQELLTTLDATTGISSKRWHTTLTYRKRYQSVADVWQLRYRRTWMRGGTAANYYGLNVRYEDVAEKHRVPASAYDYEVLTLRAEVGVPVWQRRDLVLWLRADGGLGTGDVQGDFDCGSDDGYVSAVGRASRRSGNTDADAATLVASESIGETYAYDVLMADGAYRTELHWLLDADVELHFPMTVKARRMTAFVRIYTTQRWQPDGPSDDCYDLPWGWSGHRGTVGVAFGVIH